MREAKSFAYAMLSQKGSGTQERQVPAIDGYKLRNVYKIIVGILSTTGYTTIYYCQHLNLSILW